MSYRPIMQTIERLPASTAPAGTEAVVLMKSRSGKEIRKQLNFLRSAMEVSYSFGETAFQSGHFVYTLSYDFSDRGSK